MSVLIGIRSGTASDLNTKNPQLSTQQWGIESDTGKIKIGGGAWNDIDYAPFSIVANSDITRWERFQTIADQAAYEIPAFEGLTIQIEFVQFGKMTFEPGVDYSISGTTFTILNTAEGIEAGTWIIIAYTIQPTP